MKFDLKKLIAVGVSAAKVFTPDKGDTALDIVSGIIGSPDSPNEDATKALAVIIDALVKEVGKLRREVDALKRAKK